MEVDKQNGAAVHCGEEADKPEGEPLNLPFDLRHELWVMTERTRSLVGG